MPNWKHFLPVVLLALAALLQSPLSAQCPGNCLGAISLPKTQVGSAAMINVNTSESADLNRGYFKIALTGVDPDGGFVISNSDYAGWCADFQSAPSTAGPRTPFSTYSDTP